jgi:hypothetical protein
MWSLWADPHVCLSPAGGARAAGVHAERAAALPGPHAALHSGRGQLAGRPPSPTCSAWPLLACLPALLCTLLRVLCVLHAAPTLAVRSRFQALPGGVVKWSSAVWPSLASQLRRLDMMRWELCGVGKDSAPASAVHPTRCRCSTPQVHMEKNTGNQGGPEIPARSWCRPTLGFFLQGTVEVPAAFL